MASIQKRGKSYQITVSLGYGTNGKQIRRTMTWRPCEGMTERQIKRTLSTEAALFENRVRSGELLGGSIKLSAFADMWFRDYAEQHLREKTLTEYRALMRRIDPFIGHIRLRELRPHHLMELYSSMSREHMRLDNTYRPLNDIKKILASRGMTQRGLAASAGIALSTASAFARGGSVSKDTMRKLSEALPEAEFAPIERNSGRLSDKTISEYHRFLSSMLTAAVQWQLISYNPCSRVKPPKVRRTEAKGLDEKQTAELIACLEEEPLRYRAIVMLALYTGMRRGEICGLDWSDIDFERGTVHISRAVVYTVSAGVHESETKTESSKRTINIPDSMLELLRTYRQSQQRSGFAESKKVFTNTAGGLLDPDTLSSWFKSFVRRRGLPDIHFHTLRHTSATLLITAGTDIATVSKRLGHADKTTTLNVYTHAVQSADEAAARKLEEIFSQNT